MQRLAKTVLVFGIALYTTLIVLNNLTDYDSNYQFVRHVLLMDSTFPGNHGNVARHKLAGDTHSLLLDHHRVGIFEFRCLLVGRDSVSKGFYEKCRRISSGKRHGRCGPDVQHSPVAGGLSLDWRGMVFDVAIENGQRTRSSFPNVHYCWNRPALSGPTRR